eukprot:362789-Chlamydomonas_euryale.AAC.2
MQATLASSGHMASERASAWSPFPNPILNARPAPFPAGPPSQPRPPAAPGPFPNPFHTPSPAAPAPQPSRSQPRPLPQLIRLLSLPFFSTSTFLNLCLPQIDPSRTHPVRKLAASVFPRLLAQNWPELSLHLKDHL